MSSIMKALKRLEDDKVMHQPDEMKIDAEIVRATTHRPASSARMLLISLILMACGSAATYLFMKHDRTPVFSSRKEPVISSQKQPAAPTAPEIKTEQLPEAIIVVPAADTRKNKTAAPATIPPPLTHAEQDKKHPVASRPAPQEQTPSPVILPLPAPAKTAAAPALRVNGIAYQNGSVDNMAVINGIPVLRGSTVEGVIVEEIQKDRVLFQYNGEKFGISLGQSNR